MHCSRICDDRTDLFADNGELVVLELLESLLPREIVNNARRVNHAGAKKPEKNDEYMRTHNIF